MRLKIDQFYKHRLTMKQFNKLYGIAVPGTKGKRLYHITPDKYKKL